MQVVRTLSFISAVLFSQVDGQTRHFIGVYDSPLGEQHMAYPVDICVNTAAGITGSSYGVYSCSDDGTTVTYIHYDDDASCTDPNKATAGATYSIDSAEPGDLYSFECDGVNSYMIAKSVINDPTCCNGPPIFTSIAVGVCHRDFDGHFVMSACNGQEAVQYEFLDADCIERIDDIADYQLYANECVVFDTAFLVIDINTVLDRCVIDEVSVAEPSFCDAVATGTENPSTTGTTVDTTFTSEAETSTTSTPVATRLIVPTRF